ncbi:MAG: hypothetical protein U9Q67_00510 [Patescibacteria group bacterium]|nr:hypothetical protein [Patescibacteria group bacterium]
MFRLWDGAQLIPGMKVAEMEVVEAVEYRQRFEQVMELWENIPHNSPNMIRMQNDGLPVRTIRTREEIEEYVESTFDEVQNSPEGRARLIQLVDYLRTLQGLEVIQSDRELLNPENVALLVELGLRRQHEYQSSLAYRISPIHMAEFRVRLDNLAILPEGTSLLEVKVEVSTGYVEGVELGVISVLSHHRLDSGKYPSLAGFHDSNLCFDLRLSVFLARGTSKVVDQLYMTGGIEPSVQRIVISDDSPLPVEVETEAKRLLMVLQASHDTIQERSECSVFRKADLGLLETVKSMLEGIEV